MTGIGEWLKQIVMIVLLATLADLLMPTKSMQKYLRVVMGLAVIAAMLAPIVPMFRGDWADQVANRIIQETSPHGLAQSTPGNSAYARLLQTEQQKDVNLYADASLKRDIQRHFGVTVTDLTIRGTGGQSDPLTISVAVTPSRTRLGEIRSYLANLLGVDVRQVTVTESNGGSPRGS